MESQAYKRLTKKEKEIRSFSPPLLRNYGKTKPYKQIFLTFFLLFSGIILLYFTYLNTHLPNYERISSFVLSILLIITGSYYVNVIINVWRGQPGYTYQMLEINQN